MLQKLPILSTNITNNYNKNLFMAIKQPYFAEKDWITTIIINKFTNMGVSNSLQKYLQK
jgi:hypothetical protein